MNKEEAKKRISQALEIKAREDSHIIGLPYVSWGETADKIDAIIDSLTIDHPKVKLPREVGEELDAWKRTNFDENLSGYIQDVDSAMDDVEKVMRWIYRRDDTSEQKRTELYGILADAYRYGWEAEKEAMYNVKVPFVQAQGGLWFYINSDDKLDAIYIKELAKKFTMNEIEENGLQDCEKEEVTDDDD